MKALVFIPTYNERDNIEPLTMQILGLGSSISVLVIDDNSPDGTGEIADKLAEGEPRISVIHRQSKQGLGTACIAGFYFALAADFDLIIEMDADFSHDPRYLPELIGAAEAADVAVGSRYVRGGGVRNWGVHRKFLSRSANFFARKMLDLRVHDCTSGFRCYRRGVLEKLELDDIVSNGYSFQVEVLYRCKLAGLKIVEIPIIFVDREKGKSKMSGDEIIKGMLSVFRLRRRFKRW